MNNLTIDYEQISNYQWTLSRHLINKLTRVGEQFRFTYTTNTDKILKYKKSDLNNESNK